MKEKLNKLGLLTCSVFLAWQSYQVMLYLPYLNADSAVFLFFYAWVINLFITGVFAFAGFALPTQNLLPNKYYQITNKNRLRHWYRLCKVEWYRQALLATLWKSQKQRAKYFDGSFSGITNLDTQSKKSEFGHLLPFVIINIVCMYFVLQGLYVLALITLAINIIGNFYPILLQRHHRMRILLLKNRRDR